MKRFLLYTFTLSAMLTVPIARVASCQPLATNEEAWVNLNTVSQSVTLTIYDDDGISLGGWTITPGLGKDWGGDWDSPTNCTGCEFFFHWESEDDEFITFSFTANGESLGIYSYSPYANNPGRDEFYNPYGATGSPDVIFTINEDGPGGDLSMHTSGQGGTNHESVFQSGVFTIPYDWDTYGVIPDPEFFFAKVPSVPTAANRTFYLAPEGDSTVPASWGDVEWDNIGVTLKGAENRAFVVEADLTASGVTFEAADPADGWLGIEVYSGGTLDFDGVTVENADVGITVHSTGNRFENVILNENGVGLLTGCVKSQNGLCTTTRSSFNMVESCVTASDFDQSVVTSGRGIWARHTNAQLESTTVQDNDSYGLFLENADVEAYDVLVTGSGFGNSNAEDGARSSSNGDLILSSYFTTCSSESFGPGGTCGSGDNAIRDNRSSELSIHLDGYAMVGDICGIKDCPGVNRISDNVAFGPTNLAIDNQPVADVSAEYTYWFGTVTDPPHPDDDAFADHTKVEDEPASTDVIDPLSTAGAPDCDPATSGSVGGSSQSAKSSSDLRGGEPTIDPEDAAWLRARMARLRSSLVANPESDSALSVLGELYRLQRLDRTNVLGEHANTTGMLSSLRALLMDGSLSPRIRSAAEGAFIMLVHDAMHDERNSQARAMLNAFGSRLEGESAIRSASLAYAALDELDGNLRSAVGQMDGVLASLGEGDESLANDLIATISLLERRMGIEPERREFGPSGQAVAQSLESTETGFSLRDAYPNPFNPETVIPFQLESSAVVTIAVYDALGREVAVVANGAFDAGVHEARFNGESLPSGTYFIRASVQDNSAAESAVLTQRITLLK